MFLEISEPEDKNLANKFIDRFVKKKTKLLDDYFKNKNIVDSTIIEETKFNQELIKRTLESIEFSGMFYEQQLWFLLVAAKLEENEQLLNQIIPLSTHSFYCGYYILIK